MGRPTLWRRVRRATRAPRNAVLARSIVGVGRLVGLLPVPVALGFGRGLGAAAHRVVARARRLSIAHVGVAFPALDVTARRRLVRDMFRHAGASFTELALFPKLPPDYVTVAGGEVLDQALAGRKGAVVITGHCGNWELLAAHVAARYPTTVVVRRVREVRFDALVVAFRRAAGIEVLARDDPHFLSQVGGALRRNRLVAFLIDQDIQGAGVFVPFFGRPAHTPPGAAVLALRARVPVLTAFIERRPDGGHLARFAALRTDVDRTREGVIELTARMTAAIEAQIRRAPGEWVWWHQRWRRQPQDHHETVASPPLGDRATL